MRLQESSRVSIHKICTVQREILKEEILMDTDRMSTIFRHAPVNTVMLLKIDRLNFDGIAGKHQASKFPLVKILRYTVYITLKNNWDVVYSLNVYVLLEKSSNMRCLEFSLVL